MAIQEILDRFSDGTTVHGLPKAIRSHSPSGRTFWIVACLLAVVLCSVQFAQLLTKYYSYPKKVTIEVVASDVPFPAISLCNMRNLDSITLNELNRIFNNQEERAHILKWDQNTSHPFINKYMHLMNKYYPMFTQCRDIETYVFQVALSRTTIATNINRSLVLDVGIPFKEFIVSCIYGGSDCADERYFTQFFDPYYYNCYTYNAPKHSDSDSMLAEGLENGWSAVVLTGSGMLDRNDVVRMIPGTHELHSPQASNEGVRVVIHPNDSLPFPHTEGFDVPPGHSVSFGLRPKETRRIKQPHGNCTGSDGYRLIECQKRCVQQGIIRRCKCKDINLPISDDDAVNVPYCSDDYNVPQRCENGPTDDCKRQLYRFYNRTKCARDQSVALSRNATLMRQCGCFPPCHELGYDVTYSLSKWPAQSFDGEEAFIDIFHNINYLQRFSNETAKFELYTEHFNESHRHKSMKDFARLNVYIADSNVIKTVESEDYQTSQLLSDIGGQLGLWIGVSIISLSELIELVIDIGTHLVRRHILNRKRRAQGRDAPRASQTTSRSNGSCRERHAANATVANRHKPQYYASTYLATNPMIYSPVQLTDTSYDAESRIT